MWEAGHFLEEIFFSVFQHAFMELLLYSEAAGRGKSDMVPMFMVFTTEEGTQRSSKKGIEAH